jgi:hypothetical protein
MGENLYCAHPVTVYMALEIFMIKEFGDLGIEELKE